MMGCELTTWVWLKALLVVLAFFTSGLIVGYAVGRRKRLDAIESRVERLEVRAGLRKV